MNLTLQVWRQKNADDPGRMVTYQDANGMTQTGVVTKTKLNGDSEPTLVVGNMDVQLSKVTEVRQTSDSSTAKEI